MQSSIYLIALIWSHVLQLHHWFKEPHPLCLIAFVSPLIVGVFTGNILG